MILEAQSILNSMLCNAKLILTVAYKKSQCCKHRPLKKKATDTVIKTLSLVCQIETKISHVFQQHPLCVVSERGPSGLFVVSKPTSMPRIPIQHMKTHKCQHMEKSGH